MSGKVNDEDDALLSAYLDRELPQNDVERLRQRLAAEPALARRLQDMRSANAAVRDAFAAGDEAPLPEAVLDLLKAPGPAKSGGAAAGGRPLRFPARGARRWLQAPVAIAASVALVAGFLIHGLLRQAPPAAGPWQILYTGTVPRASKLHQLLETGVSGDPAILASGVDGRLLLTFESSSGDWCRHMALSAGARSMQGLACRRDGRWEMEAVSFGPEAQPGGEYRAAAAEVSAAVDAAIDARIGDAAPLAPEEERDLIAKAWKKPAE